MSSGASLVSRTEETGPLPPVVRAGRWPVVVAKGLAVGLWTALIVTLLLLLWLPTMARTRWGPAWKERARRWAKRAWGKGMMRALNVRVTTGGEPPPPGALIVSNHLGYLDMPMLNSVVPMTFVARADLRHWPFWGYVSVVGGTIFVDRATKRDVLRVREEMGEALARGDGVVVFAEATSTAGETILPLKSALLADAAANGVPVHWLTVSYRTPPDGPAARDQVCWWGDTGFVPHVLGLFALRRVDCTVRFGDAPIRSTDRKALAVDLRRAMLRRFEPVAGREIRREPAR